MTLVFVAEARQRSTVWQPKVALGALQCLDVRLLIDAQHQRILKKVEVEANDVGGLGRELRGDSDLTYVATWGDFVYVVFVIDAFSRIVVGWRASSSLRSDLALDALERSLYGRPVADGLVHHSDRGVQTGLNRSSPPGTHRQHAPGRSSSCCNMAAREPQLWWRDSANPASGLLRAIHRLCVACIGACIFTGKGAE